LAVRAGVPRCGNSLKCKTLCPENKLLWPGFCILVVMARETFFREAAAGMDAEKI
jgi:hypothetical protein